MSDYLENTFKQLKNQFDIEEPPVGHFKRFETKLNRSNNTLKYVSIIGIAASILLFFGIWVGSSYSNSGLELASISPKMEETQTFFTLSIKKEIEAVEKERNKDNEKLIDDAFNELKKLELEYTKLTFELKENTTNKRIIYAMVLNFQQRIEVLQNLPTQLNNVKQSKIKNYETAI